MSEYDPAADDEIPVRPGDWLARELAEDPYLMPGLHDLRDQFPGQLTDDQRLQLRQLLDRGIRERVRWPAGPDYARAAEDMEAAGWLEHASVLRQLVGTDPLLDQVRSRWRWRYAGTRTRAGADIDKLAETGNLEYAGVEKTQGIDGAWYERAFVTGTEHAGYAVDVTGRGLRELISFGSDERACRQWLASRGGTAFAPLSWSGNAGSSRTGREEQLLAAMIRDPVMVAAQLPWCSPDTFTADARYEIYTALLSLAETSPRWYPWQAAERLIHRQHLLPADPAGTLGAPGIGSLCIYLERLIETPVPAGQAAQAAQRIREDDARARREIRHAGDAARYRQDDPDLECWRRLSAGRAAPGLPVQPPVIITAPVGDMPQPPPPQRPGPAPRI